MPPRHQTCGSLTEPRWVLADDGDEAIVAWCPTCDYPPGPDELDRRLEFEDVPPSLIRRSSKLGPVQ